MNSYREPEYDDTVCACGKKLPETVTPYTWQDHGFCSLACAVACHEPIDLHGTEPVLELARMGTNRGPGFEEYLIREWQRELRALPDGMLWLAKRHGPDDQTRASAESWAWRVFLTDTRGTFTPRCLAFRLTAKRSV
jgi:hypothetical protein